MSSFFYRRLNFFNKSGNPLNFDYIGATGPSPLDKNFTFTASLSVTQNGDVDVNQFDLDPAYIEVYNKDSNGFSLDEWVSEINNYILYGADVYLEGRVVGSQNFSGKISSIVNNGTTYTINFSEVKGQRIISPKNIIYFSTVYKNRPGGYYKGNIYFDPVSSGLYENEQIFVVQPISDGINLNYSFPHTGATGATSGKWRSRWYNDNYGETDISDIIFTYKIESQLEGGDGKPLIVNYPNVVFPVDVDPTDTVITGGYVQSSTINSIALGINVALNASDLASDIYERKLIIEDISSGTPEKIIEIDFYGEIVGEDERFEVMLQNMGRAFLQSDSVLLRDHDPSEPLPNFLEINSKRKELLLAGEEIFPYIGSYKGLINAIKFFGYQDLRIKEYWLNLEYRSLRLETPLQKTTQFLNDIKLQQSKGYTQSYQVSDVLDNPNSGKYKLTQTYGPNKDGEYVLTVSSEDTLLPSNTYKKTSLFGLYYDINKTTGNESLYGYPEVVDAFQFTQEEVLVKLFGLKERLKRDYLPLNARIIDITGEGIYFEVYNSRSWTDAMSRPDIDSGFYMDFKVSPDFGFIEDLRNFSTRPLSTSIQTPESYNDYFEVQASVTGGTASAFYFSGIPATGPNPVLSVTAGKTYEFSFTTSGYEFYLTSDPGLSQITPLGIENNGSTSGGPNLVWYVNPQQTSPVYYYSPQNKTLLNGQIKVLPSSISDLGNISDPLANQQNYTAIQNEYMLTAISNYYTLKQDGSIIELGDSNQDPQNYIDPSTNHPYQLPVGVPIVLELIIDTWSWDEINVNWDSILIPVFKVGDRVKVKSTGIFGTVTGVSYSTGEYTVLLDTAITVVLGESELFSSIQNYGLLTWKSIDFSNMVEIEWIVNKSATQSGSPYNFQFRGPILDFYKLAHFVPYAGEYQVTCNVYDAFNAKINLTKKSALVVEPKVVDIDAWTRFREIEFYNWKNVYKSWEDYNSIWEYPAEGQTLSSIEKTIPQEILNYAAYGNKAEDGQSLYVKVDPDPIGATGYITFTQSNINISEITSYQIAVGQYSFATVICSSPHGLSTGDEVTIFKTIPQITGRWSVIVPSGSTNTFKIPVTLDSTWNSIVGLTGPNRISVDSSPLVYPNQYFTGSGIISVYVNGKMIGSTETGDSLYRTANQLVSSVNSLKTYPDYLASCPNPSADPVTVIIYAPDELGAQQNNVPISFTLSGSLSKISSSSVLSGGVSPSETYVYWSESSVGYPNANLRYWGTKRLNWTAFVDNTWEDAYAHSWSDFEYNNDWLGGLEIHNISPGDFIKLSTANEFYPFPIGITAQPGISGLTVQELADQLNNSTDPNITNFYYRPIPNESGSLSLNSPPINLDVNYSNIPDSTYAPPPSSSGGSSFVVDFSYSTTP